jgi:hypothetical protein
VSTEEVVEVVEEATLSETEDTVDSSTDDGSVSVVYIDTVTLDVPDEAAEQFSEDATDATTSTDLEGSETSDSEETSGSTETVEEDSE